MLQLVLTLQLRCAGTGFNVIPGLHTWVYARELSSALLVRGPPVCYQ